MELHQHYLTLLGGLLVGFAAGMVLLANGRVAGVSGMAASVVRPRSVDAAWQALFLVGLVAGGMLMAWLDPAALPTGQVAPLQLVIGAGMLVGFGIRLEGGCTSGHARFGAIRFSRRSMIAVACFVVVAAVAAFVTNSLLGGP